MSNARYAIVSWSNSPWAEKTLNSNRKVRAITGPRCIQSVPPLQSPTDSTTNQVLLSSQNFFNFSWLPLQTRVWGKWGLSVLGLAHCVLDGCKTAFIVIYNNGSDSYSSPGSVGLWLCWRSCAGRGPRRSGERPRAVSLSSGCRRTRPQQARACARTPLPPTSTGAVTHSHTAGSLHPRRQGRSGAQAAARSENCHSIIQVTNIT